MSAPMDKELMAALNGKRLFVGTPAYGQQVYCSYAASLSMLVGTAKEAGVGVEINLMGGMSVLPAARNLICEGFLKSECSHLLFVDADIGFDPLDALFMLGIMDDDAPYDVMAGAVPKRQTPLTYAFEGAIYSVQTPQQIELAGTGFMMIKRGTFARLLERFPDRKSVVFDKTTSQSFPRFFDNETHDGQYFCEDYSFCRIVAAAGMKIWLCPWMRFSHVGASSFEGCLAEEVLKVRSG